MMRLCYKAAKIGGLIFGKIAIVLVILGIIGYILWLYNGSPFLNVKHYWNFFWISVPFGLVSMCCTLWVIAAKEKKE
jgi:uncharacterized membrane protein YiaA